MIIYVNVDTEKEHLFRLVPLNVLILIFGSRGLQNPSLLFLKSLLFSGPPTLGSHANSDLTTRWQSTISLHRYQACSPKSTK